jgi:hypothetical protein
MIEKPDLISKLEEQEIKPERNQKLGSKGLDTIREVVAETASSIEDVGIGGSVGYMTFSNGNTTLDVDEIMDQARNQVDEKVIALFYLEPEKTGNILDSFESKDGETVKVPEIDISLQSQLFELDGDDVYELSIKRE